MKDEGLRTKNMFEQAAAAAAAAAAAREESWLHD